MDTTTTLAGRGPLNNRDYGLDVGLAHEVRRVIGRGWKAIEVSGEKIRRSLGIHHSQVSYRKDGRGAVANAGMELVAMELEDIPTDSLLDALKKVVLRARALANPAARCIRSLIHRKACADTDEDRLRDDYHAGVPGACARWVDALLAEAREAETLAAALMAEGQVAR